LLFEAALAAYDHQGTPGSISSPRPLHIGVHGCLTTTYSRADALRLSDAVTTIVRLTHPPAGLLLRPCIHDKVRRRPLERS